HPSAASWPYLPYVEPKTAGKHGPTERNLMTSLDHGSLSQVPALSIRHDLLWGNIVSMTVVVDAYSRSGLARSGNATDSPRLESERTDTNDGVRKSGRPA